MNTFKTLTLFGLGLATFNLTNAQLSPGDEVGFNSINTTTWTGGFSTNGSLSFPTPSAITGSVFGGFEDYLVVGAGILDPSSTVQFYDIDYWIFNGTTASIDNYLWEKTSFSPTTAAGGKVAFTLVDNVDYKFTETDAGANSSLTINGSGFVSVFDASDNLIQTADAVFILTGTGDPEGGPFSWSATTTVVPEISTYSMIFGFIALGAVYLMRRRSNS